jgi:hypothetical protein
MPDRATAYGRKDDGTFFTNMSFTDVIGNGGLLSTVGDFLMNSLSQPVCTQYSCNERVFEAWFR